MACLHDGIVAQPAGPMVQMHVIEPEVIQPQFVEGRWILFGESITAQVQPAQARQGSQAVDIGRGQRDVLVGEGE
ncbi:hypothetical protein D3C76_959380 [compost metagenome]